MLDGGNARPAFDLFAHCHNAHLLFLGQLQIAILERLPDLAAGLRRASGQPRDKRPLAPARQADSIVLGRARQELEAYTLEFGS